MLSTSLVEKLIWPLSRDCWVRPVSDFSIFLQSPCNSMTMWQLQHLEKIISKSIITSQLHDTGSNQVIENNRKLLYSLHGPWYDLILNGPRPVGTKDANSLALFPFKEGELCFLSLGFDGHVSVLSSKLWWRNGRRLLRLGSQAGISRLNDPENESLPSQSAFPHLNIPRGLGWD